MPGAILENLSGRKLAILVSILIICQIACFLIGGLIAPTPASAESVLATKCLDPGNNSLKWFYTRGVGSCNVISLTGFEPNEEQKLANQIVFAFQIPLPRDNTILDYSRWQQNLIGVLQLDIKYHPDTEMARHTVITLDARLGFRNRGDPDDAWKHYASSVEERTLECTIDKKREGYIYNCSIIPLFELGSLHHDYYLLDVRLPVDDESSMNQGLGHIVDLWLVVINQNGGFTKVWVSLKTVFFPIIVAIMIWFWNRVSQLSRSPALLEYMLMALGGSLTFLNLPLEYLTLTFDMPYMLLLGDIRQGIFYASLLSFWLVFAGEHLMVSFLTDVVIMTPTQFDCGAYSLLSLRNIYCKSLMRTSHEGFFVSNLSLFIAGYGHLSAVWDDAEHSTLKSYWKNLSAVAVGCLSLFIFDICERGVQLRNPFYSIWVTSIGTNLALTFIILAAISAVIYFLFLSYMIRKVFCNISAKRNILPSMSSLRRLHYEGVIYRFKFMMLATLLCAAMTVIGFILGQISEGHWKWDEDIQLEYTSAFFTGVYGMWNIYIFALLVLYAPSHKQWPSESEQHGSVNEEIEFSRLPTEPSEISSLASFTRKAAMD